MNILPSRASITTNSAPRARDDSNVGQQRVEVTRDSNKKPSRHLWWQKSIVRRSLSSIEPDLDRVFSKSPFLRAQHAKYTKADVGIALFHRREIIVGALLGKGGFSFVYEITGFCLDPAVSSGLSQEERTLREFYAESARDEQTGACRYCIKHLQDRLTQNPKDFQCAASDLAVEAAFMQAVDHPHILKLRALPIEGLGAWDNGSHDGYFIVTDRLSNTLDKLVQKWKLQGRCDRSGVRLTEKYRYALELADALDYLHGNRIVFRDLKPHNIGLDKAGHIKLFDFGLCRELPDTEEGMDGLYHMSGVGTRRYMACEIINTGRYNLKADVYSWSMIFWEMMALQKPYAPYSTDDHRREVCRGGERPKLDPQWPIWLQSLLRMSWDESVKYRFSMEDAYHGLKSGMLMETSDWSQSDHAPNDFQPSPESPTAVVEYALNMHEQTPSRSYDSNGITDVVPKKRTVYLKLPEEAKRTYLDIESSLIDSSHGNE